MHTKWNRMPKPLGGHRPLNNSTFSIVGSDTTITGNLNASTDLHVDGRVEGDLTCNSLVQGERSEIVGNVAAESVRIAGKVEGTVSAREVVILKSARILGDIVYDALTIEQGARLDGRLSPRASQSAPTVLRPDSSEPRLTLAAPAN